MNNIDDLSSTEKNESDIIEESTIHTRFVSFLNFIVYS